MSNPICPRCGSENVVAVINELDTRTWRWQAHCDNCGADGNWVSGDFILALDQWRLGISLKGTYPAISEYFAPAEALLAQSSGQTYAIEDKIS
ncbi:MAG: hypothetical protein KJ077_07690 [Anaerolineae bacterium]|nr:hypothetical protein [Anaerolineae bacterium]